MGWFQRLNEGLSKTRFAVRQSLDRFLGRPPEPALLEELEAALLSADLGGRVVDRLMRQVKEEARGEHAATVQALQNVLSRSLYDILTPVSGPSFEQLVEQGPKPFVTLVVGVNGVGKTTTIAKLAQRARRRNAKHLVFEQRNESRRYARLADLCQSIKRRKRQIKIARFDNSNQLVDRIDRAQLSERLDRVISDICICVSERGYECWNRAGIALIT